MEEEEGDTGHECRNSTLSLCAHLFSVSATRTLTYSHYLLLSNCKKKAAGLEEAMDGDGARERG